jgi:DMSO/TMAO reductase YedYZ heme-binding membrane subunit
MTGGLLARIREATATAVYAVATLVGCVAAGYLFASVAEPVQGTRMLPWSAGRSLGLASYVSLTALTVVGTWIRHPWRFRWPLLHPEVRVRVHATLGAGTVVLVIAHLTALALDPYAGVGWVGAFVPGQSGYRTVPVALGVVAFETIVLIAVTAWLAGRIGGGRWLTVHRLAVPAFLLAWLHGVLAGTDTVALRSVYAGTGLFVLALLATRVLAEPSPVAAEGHLTSRSRV